MPSRIEVAYKQYKHKSLFDLYVAKEQTNRGSEDYSVILALIEVRKYNRDWWTLVAALVAAIASLLSLVLSLFGH